MGVLSKLADALLNGATRGAEMYGAASQPAPPEVIKGVLDFSPGVGDALSLYDAMDSVRKGEYGSAALNGIGVLPFIPSLGNVIKHIPSPAWNTKRKTIPVGVNPTKDEIVQLFMDQQSRSAQDTLRTLKDHNSKTLYAWPADAALHQDIGAFFKLNPSDTVHGMIIP